MKRLLLFCLLLSALSSQLSTQVFAQNRLKDKTEATTPAADDWFYLDGATNGVRKYDAEKVVTKTSSASPGVANTTVAIGDNSGDTALTLTGSSEAGSTANSFTFNLRNASNSLTQHYSVGFDLGAGKWATNYYSTLLSDYATAYYIDPTTNIIEFPGIVGLPGSTIRTPATVTITEASPDTGTITITNGNSTATIDEATTFSFSAVGTNGQRLTLKLINSTGSAVIATLTGCTPSTTTVAPNSSPQTYTLESNGSAWSMIGGDTYAVLPVASGGTGTATPSIVAGTNVTVTGTWPNQTINSSGGSGSLPIGHYYRLKTTLLGSAPANTLVADGTNGTATVAAADGLTTVVQGGAPLTGPTVSPVAGEYASAQTITLAPSTVGATVKYTLDDSAPSRSAGSTYSGTFSLNPPDTLKVMEYFDHYADSTPTTHVYTAPAAGVTFDWNFSSDTPSVSTGDNSPTYVGSASRTSVGGQNCVATAGATSYAQFTTDPTSNPDFDTEEGTIEFYFRWTGTWTANSTTQVMFMGATSGGDAVYVAARTTQGDLRIHHRDSAFVTTTATASGASSPDTWYKITGKWRHSTSPYMFIQIDAGTPGTGTTAMGADSGTPTQIIVGNNTSSTFSFYVGQSFKIWSTWQ